MDEFQKEVLKIPQVKQVLELIGLIATAWSDIEDFWYLIYTCFMHETPRPTTDHIYKHFATFAAQRPFIRHLAEYALQKHPNLLEEFKVLFQVTESLQPRRNQAVHAVYWFDALNGPPGLRVSAMGEHTKRQNELSKIKDLVAELTKTFEAIDNLSRRIDTFRLILTQEFLPEGKRSRPIPPETLAKMPAEVCDRLPRDLRERIAPPKLRSPD